MSLTSNRFLEKLVEIYNWSEGRSWLLVSITSFQTFQVEYVSKNKTQKLEGIIEPNENINLTIQKIFSIISEKIIGDTSSVTPTLVLDLPWLLQLPQTRENGFEKKKKTDSELHLNFETSEISLSAKIPESTVTVFKEVLQQYKIEIHSIISLQTLGWYLMVKHLKANSNPILYTANGLLVCHQDNSFSEPIFEWISFTAKPENFESKTISDFISQFQLVDHLSEWNNKNLISLLDLRSLTTSIRKYEFETKLPVSELSEKQHSIYQLKMVTLTVGSLFVFLSVVIFCLEYYYSGQLEQNIEWRVTNSSPISKMERIEKRNQAEPKANKEENISGLTVDRISDLNSGLSDNIVFYKWSLNSTNEIASKLLGFTNSQTEISKYISHLNQMKNVKSAKLILLSPIDRNNKSDAAFAGKFNLKFVIEVEFNV